MKYLLFLLIATSAHAYTPCQQFIFENWPNYGMDAWRVAAQTGDNCYILRPTLADANTIAEQWINGTSE